MTERKLSSSWVLCCGLLAACFAVGLPSSGRADAPPAARAPEQCEAPPELLPASPDPIPAALVDDFEAPTRRMNRGEFAAARAAYLAAAEAAAAAGAAPAELRARANALRAGLDAGELDGLAEEAEGLVEAARRLASPATRARLLINLARSQMRIAALVDGARDALFGAAAEALVAAHNAALEARDMRAASYALGYLAELYESQGRDDEARELTRRALFRAQEANSAEALFRWQWQLGRLDRRLGDDDRALAHYRAAVRTLSELKGQLALASADTQASFRSQVSPVYDGLVDLLLREVSEAGDQPRDQELLREARNALEDLKAAELRDFFQDECLDAQRKAAPDEIPGALVIYPIILPDRLELIASESGRLTRHVSRIDEATLTQRVRAFRDTLVKRTTYQYMTHADVLYDWLVRPLAARLAEGGIDTLVWVPGGVLRTIPMAALYDEPAKQFLIEQFPIAVAPSLTLTNPRAIDRRKVELLAAGISESVMGYPPLTNVPREIDALSEVFPSEQLMNSEFSVENFAERMSEAPHGIVHIASHGEFAADSAESYVLAYGERLSMDRLAGLVGATRFREEPLELLTLSACKTAAGDERSALGLAGVALQAGARSALATLWSVDDAVAADLVSEFYVQLADPSQSRARALQNAQLKTMKQFRFRHAAYWAPFLLISSWL